MNQPAKFLTDYKKDRQHFQRIDRATFTLEELQRNTNTWKNADLSNLLKYSIDAITCLRSKQDAYIKVIEFAIESLDKTPLGKLVNTWHGPGFKVLFAAIRAGEEAFPLLEAIRSANDVCEDLAAQYERVLTNHKFDTNKMGQGIFTHFMINHRAYESFSKEELKHITNLLTKNAKELVKMLELLIISGVSLSEMMPEIKMEVEKLGNEAENSFQKIASSAASRDFQFLWFDMERTNLRSKISRVMELRDKWASWADITPAKADKSYYISKAKVDESW
jgi:predicted metal-dependent phosphoesterase TrpH